MTARLISEAEALVAKARNTLQTTQTQTTIQKDGNQMETTTTTTAVTASQVAASYTGGKSIVEVASALGITYGKARKLLAESGTQLRDSSERLKGRTRPIKAKA
jgi:hypothetical protein